MVERIEKLGKVNFILRDSNPGFIEKSETRICTQLLYYFNFHLISSKVRFEGDIIIISA